MKVLVTGGTGFLGTRLVTRLAADGADVVVLSRQDSPGFPDGVRTVAGDVLQPGPWQVELQGCARVYHLAGLITFDPRRKDELVRVNGEGTATVLDAARRHGAERAVLVSSACTLGLSPSAGTVLDEESEAPEKVAAMNPYLFSKRAGELEALKRVPDFPVTIVNPTTVFGPGDSTLNSGTLIAQVAGSPAVPLPPGGSNVVDVDDVVDGILAAGEKGRPGRRYVLGGENLPFAEILDTIAEVVGRRPMRVPLPRWTRGPMTLAARILMALVGGRFMTPQIVGDLFAYKYYSSDRARGELGWIPRFRFRDSVTRAWEYYVGEGLINPPG